MAVTIHRTPWIDDDGTGQTGTVLNNAMKMGLYDEVDAALAQCVAVDASGYLTRDLLWSPDATYDIGKSLANRPRDVFCSRNLTAGGLLTVTGFGTHAFTGSGAGGNVLNLTNTQDGANNYAQLSLTAGTASGGMFVWPQSYSSVGANIANSLHVFAPSPGGLSIQTSHASAAIRFYTGGTTERMRLDSSGNVGIGIVPGAATYRLHVKGTDTTTGFGILLVDSAEANTMYVLNSGAGFLKAAGWTYGSDRALKEHITYFADGLETIRQLRPVRFDYRDDGPKRQVGFIAQDVQPVIPDAVTVTNADTGLLGLKPSFILPFVVNALNELDARLAHLEGRL